MCIPIVSWFRKYHCFHVQKDAKLAQRIFNIHHFPAFALFNCTHTICFYQENTLDAFPREKQYEVVKFSRRFVVDHAIQSSPIPPHRRLIYVNILYFKLVFARFLRLFFVQVAKLPSHLPVLVLIQSPVSSLLNYQIEQVSRLWLYSLVPSWLILVE